MGTLLTVLGDSSERSSVIGYVMGDTVDITNVFYVNGGYKPFFYDIPAEERRRQRKKR